MEYEIKGRYGLRRKLQRWLAPNLESAYVDNWTARKQKRKRPTAIGRPKEDRKLPERTTRAVTEPADAMEMRLGN